MSVRIVWRCGTPYDEHSMMITTLRVCWPSIRSLHIASVCILILHLHHDGTSMFLRFSTPWTIFTRDPFSSPWLHKHLVLALDLQWFSWLARVAQLHSCMRCQYHIHYLTYIHLSYIFQIHNHSITISSKLTHVHFIISYPYIYIYIS